MVEEFVMQEYDQQQQKVRGRKKGHSITSWNHWQNTIGLSGLLMAQETGCWYSEFTISQWFSGILGSILQFRCSPPWCLSSRKALQ